MYEYQLKATPDYEFFRRQCDALPQRLDGAERGTLLQRQDGAYVQLFFYRMGRLNICCDEKGVYVLSDADISAYLPL